MIFSKCVFLSLFSLIFFLVSKSGFQFFVQTVSFRYGQFENQCSLLHKHSAGGFFPCSVSVLSYLSVLNTPACMRVWVCFGCDTLCISRYVCTSSLNSGILFGLSTNLMMRVSAKTGEISLIVQRNVKWGRDLEVSGICNIHILSNVFSTSIS